MFVCDSHDLYSNTILLEIKKKNYVDILNMWNAYSISITLMTNLTQIYRKKI